MNKRLALVVGINEYAYLDNLSTAAKDAEEVAQLLVRWGNFDVHRLPIAPVEGGECEVAPKGQVMADNLETEIADLFNQPPDLAPLTALLYFSGHGGRDNLGDKTEGYLLAHDANPRTKDGYFSLKRLRQILQDSPVQQQIIILDCCYSAELFNFTEDELGGEQQGRSRCFIAASLRYQVAYERRSENHSLLTGALLKGLNPEGKPRNCVTSYSLVDFIRQELKGTLQVPVCASPGSEIPLTATNPVLADICPYKGLQYFDESDRDVEFFKGRSKLTGELIKKVKSSKFLAVLGASGSGKSSVVRAGLLHKLKQGALPESQGWKYAVMTPGEHPLESLKKALESLNLQQQGVRVLLVVDQFEEVFTLCEDDTKRQQFFECLMAAVNPTGAACGAESLDASPLQGLDVSAILVMRSDFFGKCTEREYAGLAKQIERHLVIVLPMTEAELREAIEEPAKQVRLEIEPELVQRMIADVKDSPGSLPLLQYALLLLWEGRTVHLNRLTEGAYTQLGGVSGTLQKRADDVYNSLENEKEKPVAKEIFLALTQVGQGTEDTRRQVSKADLLQRSSVVGDGVIEDVLQKLTDAKLIVTRDLGEPGSELGKKPVVDIAHEALIRHWPLLRQWLDENREALLRKQKIQEGAEEWRDNGKPDDTAYLLKGTKLDAALELLPSYAKNSSELELYQEYIQKSQAYRERELKEKQEQIERLEKALQDATEATLREKSLRVLQEIPNKPLDALVLAIQTMGLNLDKLPGKPLSEVQESLQKAMVKARERNRLRGHQGLVNSVAVTADGQKIVSGGYDGTVRVWDMQGNPLGVLQGHEGSVRSVAVTADGQTIVSGGGDGTVRVWDMQGNPKGVLRGHEGWVNSVAVTADGQKIVSGGGDGTVRVWDMQGNPKGVLRGHQGWVNSVAVTADGQKIVSGGEEGTVRVWDMQDSPLGVLRGHQGWVNSVAVTADGQKIVSGGGDGTVRVWDMQGNPFGEPLRGHEGTVLSVAVTADGQKIVSGGGDGTVRVWDMQDNPFGEPLRVHEGYVRSVAVTADGQKIVSGGYDGTVRVWDRQGNPFGEPLRGHQGWVNSVAVTADGQKIVSGGVDGTVRVWDIQGNSLGVLRGHAGYVSSVAVTADGQKIVSGGSDGTVRVWDMQGNPLGEPLRGHGGYVRSVAVTADGQKIVSGGEDGTVRVWIEGHLFGELQGHKGAVISVAVTADGQKIVSGGGNGTVRVWDMQGNSLGEPLRGYEVWVISVAVTADGQKIVSGGEDGTVRVWDMQGNPLGEPLRGHKGYVYSVAVTADGQKIVSGGSDGMVRVWPSSWQGWLQVACHRLRYHRIFQNPLSEVGLQACETCRKYVWERGTGHGA